MTATPDTVDVNLAQTRELGNALLASLDAMRQRDPIYRSSANGVWIVTGHEEVAEGFGGRKPLSAERLPGLVVNHLSQEVREKKLSYLISSTPKWLINMDRPAQMRLRALAQKAFGPALAESMRPFVRSFIADAFRDVEALDDFEYIDKVARRIPARTILKLLDLPDSLYPRMHHWSIALNAALGGVHLPEDIIVEGEKVLLELRELFLPLVRARQERPTDDFISALVTARDENGDSLDEEEILGTLYVALIAGHDTTANTIALGTAALAQLPDARKYMREHPERLVDSIMEIMRYVAMSTMMARIVSEDFDWNGHQLKRGEIVFLMIAGANRDPKIFANPNEFDPTRSQKPNMTFAPGVHFCIGRHLAMVQLEEFFAALLRSYDPELLDQRLDFGDSLSFRGLETLHVRLNPI
jgi:pimeloyl-[acyl-carrier protein] synthase